MRKQASRNVPPHLTNDRRKVLWFHLNQMPASPLSVIARLFGMAAGIIAFFLSLGLLFVCQTIEGMGFAVAGMALGLAPILATIAWEKRSRSLWIAAVAALMTWSLITAWLFIRAPDGHTSAKACVQHRYIGSQWHFRRFILGNLLPEVDQFMLGFKLVPAVDPLFTLKQSRAVGALTSSIYKELEADPDFHVLGSVMPEAYDELWHQTFDHGHYFLYRPQSLDPGLKLPVLVFLHGSGGNFKAYTWILRQVAEELGMIIVAPSFGIGNWHEPDTSKVVALALEDAANVTPLNLQKVHLMGLSNGGLGVSQAGRALAQKFSSLCFLSPVFERLTLGSVEFTSQWVGRPVLVITGTQDDRVPFDYVSATVDMLIEAKVNVTFKPVNDADHFMLFSHRQQVIQAVIEWLRPQLGAKSGSS